jgi:hypothetical protein
MPLGTVTATPPCGQVEAKVMPGSSSPPEHMRLTGQARMLYRVFGGAVVGPLSQPSDTNAGAAEPAMQ